MSHENESLEISLKDALGATDVITSQRLTIFIPNKGRSRDGATQILENWHDWVIEAKFLLGRINQGATEDPASDGIWWKRGTVDPLEEKTKIVYSYIDDPAIFEASLPDLREFLHRFGRETRQDQVFVEFDGKSYRIEKYD